jgi:hypothetical protein
MLGGVGGVLGCWPQWQNLVIQEQGSGQRYGFMLLQLGSGGVTHSWVGGGVEMVGSEAVSELSGQSTGR